MPYLGNDLRANAGKRFPGEREQGTAVATKVVVKYVNGGFVHLVGSTVTSDPTLHERGVLLHNAVHELPTHQERP